MAINNNNMIIRGMTGSISAHQYLQIRGGKECLINKPQRPKNREPLPEEKKTQDRFKLAQAFAKRVKLDPTLKAYYTRYKKGAQSEYNVAISDAMHPPAITGHDCSAYTGKPGDLLKVEATERYKVTKVWCRICTPKGKLMEEGEAFPTGGLDEWAYTLTSRHKTIMGNLIEFTAEDMPGNKVVMSVEVK